MKEVKQSRQMNFHELGLTLGVAAEWLRHLCLSPTAEEIRGTAVRSHHGDGLDTIAFLAGNRGAMAGVGVSLGIAIVYWSVGQVFEQFGNLSLLPVQIAAWSPDAIFSLAGLYFLAHACELDDGRPAPARAAPFSRRPRPRHPETASLPKRVGPLTFKDCSEYSYQQSCKRSGCG